MAFRNEKEKIAIFVDLTNFYSQLVKSNLDSPENTREYFMDWFDFSLLSLMLTAENTDVWVFYSGEKIGGKNARITDQYMNDLIKRFNQQSGVTCHNVNISGEQREPYKSKCNRCGEETETIWKSEKGIDSSLIVHLFDTMDSWDKAYLLSGDADFVPAVKSLRRRGKIVNGVGFIANASSALIQECFEYIDLEQFFKSDFSSKQIFKVGGLISQFFKQMIPEKLLTDSFDKSREEIDLRMTLSYRYSWDNVCLTLVSPSDESESLKQELKKIFSSDKFPEKKAEENYYTYFDYRFKDVFSEHLEAIAKNLNLEVRSDRETDGFENSYTLYLVWDTVSNSYKIDTNS